MESKTLSKREAHRKIQRLKQTNKENHEIVTTRLQKGERNRDYPLDDRGRPTMRDTLDIVKTRRKKEKETKLSKLILHETTCQ